MQRNLNARLDSSEKFYDREYTLAEKTSHLWLPSNLSYASKTGPTLDQGQYGDCVAHGTEAPFYTMSLKHTGVVRNPSRAAWYAQAQNQLYPPAKDQGLETADCLVMWQQHGYVPESVRPYPPNYEPSVLLAPVDPSEWRTDYPPTRFARIKNDPTSIKCGFVSDGVLLFAGSFAESWCNQTNKDGSLPIPDTSGGGHCFAGVGYSDTKVFHDDATGKVTVGGNLCKNSWGPEYGIQPEGAQEAGYFWMPYSFFIDYPEFWPQDIYSVRAN